ncbi:MAG: F0F1 ATP synthase subunit epsilon [Gammaproteobacteria bacterium]|nr:F0F1 ATP synthase subunit epsilon [Gammaproteobacteria bacterium]
MAITMHLNIVSAEEEIYSNPAEMVIVPGSAGELGILPQHAQLLSSLKPGEVIITKPGGEQQSIFISGGIVEVQPHVVTVLSDTAIREDDLDKEKAEQAKQHAEEILNSSEGLDDHDLVKAQAELLQAIEQLKLIDKLRNKRSH